MNENVKENGRQRLGDVVETALNSIKEIADVNTVVGDPINTESGVTIIPITNVSLGFASGGVDGVGKRTNDVTKSTNFAGGGGTGIKITPVGFLVVKPDGDVSFLGMTAAQKPEKTDSILDFIERSPEFIKKLRTAFAKDKSSADVNVEELGNDAENSADVTEENKGE